MELSLELTKNSKEIDTISNVIEFYWKIANNAENYLHEIVGLAITNMSIILRNEELQEVRIAALR